ncbi:zona pellucida sperm-binding protein 4-like isoform X2 [Plectropomus leopardus]|uniref:zona pellucida sperm-binding protein 4-like isoform X2 n=1 Tax=Plectropomus leopardus TaxID=160734 RepID=UPI001C4AB2FD|nr:zona pellucida sperm-binding protein 4-like isoform X2 [Plectropomus leopardus]
MAGVRVELLVLVVLTGNLLLVPAQEWEIIDDTPQPFNSHETVQWIEPETVTSALTLTDDDSDFDNEDADLEVEGASTSETVDSFTDHGFQLEFDNAPTGNWDSGTDSDFPMEFVYAPPRSWSGSTCPSSSGLDVVCSEAGFQITLLTGSLSDVKVLGSKDLLSVTNAPESCGYQLDSFKNTLTVPFTGCNVKHSNGYSLQLLFADAFGQTQVATASCEENFNLKSGLFPRSSGQPKSSKCGNTNPTPTKATNCAVTSAERVTCGYSGISSAECEKMGCCSDSSSCYYPLDECTGDQHFVFAIRSNSASIPVDPTKLVIPGHPNCKPIIVNDKVAIFKFKVTECGARYYDVKGTKVYMAEVQSVVKALNLKYGVITRTDPLRFMIECRYGKSGEPAKQSMASVGYMVKTPSSTLPSSVVSNGLYGVSLRIAKDQTYSSYLPTYHQPLRQLLGKPVHLELRLKSPKPDAVILVNYCLAYPRSAKNALVLIYEGCANPYDQTVAILKNTGNPKNRYIRRFTVNAFQFMDQKTNKYLDEEIYFMCSTEVCRPTEKTCAERCFDGKS